MKVKDDVRRLLENYPVCRNSDKALIVYYLQMHGVNLSKEQMQRIKDLPSMESVRRARQALQMDGKYRATEQVEDLRYELFKQNRYTRGAVVAEEIM